MITILKIIDAYILSGLIAQYVDSISQLLLKRDFEVFIIFIKTTVK